MYYGVSRTKGNERVQQGTSYTLTGIVDTCHVPTSIIAHVTRSQTILLCKSVILIFDHVQSNMT